MEETRFRVGDVVRMRCGRPVCDGPSPSSDVLTRLGVPIGVDGVVKARWWNDGEPLKGPFGAWYGIAIPEMRCYTYAAQEDLEFIEHRLSPEEIAAMYAEAAQTR